MWNISEQFILNLDYRFRCYLNKPKAVFPFNFSKVGGINISYLELWWPSCLLEWNHLSNFGRGP